MPLFDITFLRLDRDESPSVIEALFLTVDWPVMPREGEGLDIAEDLEAQTVESVGCDLDGHPTVHVGRVVLGDLKVAQLRKVGRRVVPFPGATYTLTGALLRRRNRTGQGFRVSK